MFGSARSEKSKANAETPVRERALGLLMRREHSTVEMQRKLQQRGYKSTEIDACLAALQQEGILSDRRYTEAYMNSRMNRGYGPMRILAELGERGISSSMAHEFLNQETLDWSAVLMRQYNKKFSLIPIADHQDKTKRIAYLQARGFRLDLIFEVLGKG